MSITVYDTITYSQNMLVDDPVPELLQERYFPTNPTLDVFQTGKVVLDYADADLKRGAFVKKGYVSGETTVWRSKDVEPLRIGICDTVDPTGQDRVLFEQLMYPQGETQPTRADALNQLVRMKAGRLIGRAARSIETTIVEIFKNNGISGQIPTSPTDPTPVDISISFAPDSGNDQRYAPAYPWGNGSAHPYRDVTAMVDQLVAHGGTAEDLLISPEAWQLLRNDSEFRDRFSLPSNQYEGELFARDIRDAKHVGIGDFGGYLLNIIVYYRKYKDNNGVLQPILPKGFVCITRPAVGRTLCGGSVLLDRAAMVQEGIENSFVQRWGKYIASKKLDLDNNSIEIRVESRPLPAPYHPWGWIYMDAENTNAISDGKQGKFVDLDLLANAPDATYSSTALPILGWKKNAEVGQNVTLTTSNIALSGYTYDHLEDQDGNTVTVTTNTFNAAANMTAVVACFASVITFDANTGSGSMDTYSVLYGETGKLPKCTLTKSTKTFLGWATAADGEVVYDDEDDITPEGNVTLYAIWST